MYLPETVASTTAAHTNVRWQNAHNKSISDVAANNDANPNADKVATFQPVILIALGITPNFYLKIILL